MFFQDIGQFHPGCLYSEYSQGYFDVLRVYNRCPVSFLILEICIDIFSPFFFVLVLLVVFKFNSFFFQRNNFLFHCFFPILFLFSMSLIFAPIFIISFFLLTFHLFYSSSFLRWKLILLRLSFISNISIQCYKVPSQHYFSCVPQIFICLFSFVQCFSYFF